MNKSSRKNSSSEYIGVSKYGKKWVATIKVNNKKLHLGYFVDEIEAAKARDLATKEHFGKYGNLNFTN